MGSKTRSAGGIAYQSLWGLPDHVRRRYAKTVALSSFSLPVNRNSMPKRDSRTSPPAARPAVRRVRPAVLPALRVRCTTLFARNAESPPRFLSSPRRTAPYTAVSALPPAAGKNRANKKSPRIAGSGDFSYIQLQGNTQIWSKKGAPSSLHSTPSSNFRGVGAVSIYFRISSMRTLSRKVTREKLTPCLWARPVRPMRWR